MLFYEIITTILIISMITLIKFLSSEKHEEFDIKDILIDISLHIFFIISFSLLKKKIFIKNISKYMNLL